MAKDDDDIEEEYVEEEYVEIPEGVDDIPEPEPVPTQELIIDMLQRQLTQARFFSVALLVVTAISTISMYSAYESRYEVPMYVYNQATGSMTIAGSNAYEADGYLSTVAQSVALFNTWDVNTFTPTVALISNRFSDTLVGATKLTYKKRQAVWVVDGYSQQFVVKRSYWPQGSDGEPLKWVAGMRSFKVRVVGSFKRISNGESSERDVTLDVSCQFTMGTSKNPHGFIITAMNMVK